MITTYRSFAKINLHLRVLGRRDDGYHDLETLYQTVGFADRVTVELTSGAVDLTVSEGDAPAGETNLAHRAASAFLRRWAPEVGVRIDLEKRIPMGGGVGGGSSNAATVLLALQQMLGRPAKHEELHELARELGADVPYFLVGGTALGRGRGDELISIEELPERPVWLAIPPIGISTAEIFEELELANLREARAQIDWAGIGNGQWLLVDRGWNDLEETVMRCYPVVRDVYNALVDGGATSVRLSGTGATLFAFFRSPAESSELISKLPQGSRVVQTKTLSRSSLDRLRVVR